MHLKSKTVTTKLNGCIKMNQDINGETATPTAILSSAERYLR